MEPAELNLPSPDDERLAALLKAEGSELPDAGFSARVLAALPPKQRRLLHLPAVLWAAAAAALALALVPGMGGPGAGVDFGAWADQAQAALARQASDPWSLGALALAFALVTLALLEEAYL